MKIQQKLLGYQCISCEIEYPIIPFRYLCDCGENLDVIYNYPRIARHFFKTDLLSSKDRSVWRYLPLLPVKYSPEHTDIQVGGTPLIESKSLADSIGLQHLFLKDDTRNVSGSLKDRASEIGIQHASEQGQHILVAASTGNAAASLSALAAYHRKQAIIFAPASAPPAKLTQILQYGATLVPVNSHYDDAFRLSFEFSQKHNLYSRNTGINPVLSEGKKTVAFEIVEQLDWLIPDVIFVPTGDGCIIGGVYKGFYDLIQLGWIDKMPRLVAVQSEGSPAIMNAIQNDTPIHEVDSSTIADSISVNYPRDGLKAIRAITDSGGFCITVTDDEILSAQLELSSTTGIFAEPASAASVAGCKKAVESDMIRQNDSVVLLITGTGLKDIPSAQKKIQLPTPVDANLDDVESFLKSRISGFSTS